MEEEDEAKEEWMNELCDVAQTILEQADKDQVIMKLFNGDWGNRKIVGYEMNTLARRVFEEME